MLIFFMVCSCIMSLKYMVVTVIVIVKVYSRYSYCYC